MSPLMLLLTTITVLLVGTVITTVVKGTASLERQRLAHNERATGLTQASSSAGRTPAGHDRARRRPVGAGARRPAISARADGKPAPAADLPPMGARIRLDDGRTGTVTAITPISRATRVHLELDGGGSGHVDIPDTPRAAVVQRPTSGEVPASARPAVAARTTSPSPEPVAASATAGTGSSTTVRLGGFSMPVNPVGERP